MTTAYHVSRSPAPLPGRGWRWPWCWACRWGTWLATPSQVKLREGSLIALIRTYPCRGPGCQERLPWTILSLIQRLELDQREPGEEAASERPRNSEDTLSKHFKISILLVSQCSGRLHVSLTKVYDGKNMVISKFDTREELIEVSIIIIIIIITTVNIIIIMRSSSPPASSPCSLGLCLRDTAALG